MSRKTRKERLKRWEERQQRKEEKLMKEYTRIINPDKPSRQKMMPWEIPRHLVTLEMLNYIFHKPVDGLI